MALYMCQVLHVAPTSIVVLLRPTQSQSDEPSDFHGSLSPTSVYSTWQSQVAGSQAVTHPIMNWARRCIISVIEHKPLSNAVFIFKNINVRIIKNKFSAFGVEGIAD